MSGIKLTLLLPIFNQQIKHVIKSDQITYTMVLCHSNARCQQLAEFSEELTSFSANIIDIVVFESQELADMKQEWKQRCNPEEKKVENDDEEEQ